MRIERTVILGSWLALCGQIAFAQDEKAVEGEEKAERVLSLPFIRPA